jgi:hypothetical protein
MDLRIKAALIYRALPIMRPPTGDLRLPSGIFSANCLTEQYPWAGKAGPLTLSNSVKANPQASRQP